MSLFRLKIRKGRIIIKEYNVTINNGTGSTIITNGNYSVTLESNGYNNLSIDPNVLNVVEGTNEYSFTVEATGTLTLRVTDNGSETGTPIVGAVFNRTDASGTTYGAEIITNESGEAVFNNVPFDANNAPIIYFKQISSDLTHEFSSEVQTTTLSTNTYTLDITNPLAASRTINLTDKNYDNLPIDNAKITIEQNA